MTSTNPQNDRRSVRQLSISALYVGAVFLVLGCIIVGLAGQRGLEKYLTRLAQPVGLAFVLLSVAIVECFRQRRPQLTVLILAPMLLFTCFGNDLIAARMIANLEASTLQPGTDIADERSSPRFDTVVVLGGGVQVRPDGVAAGNRNADRLIRAAALYHAGQADRFVTTGSRIKGLTTFDRDESTLSREVLVSLGVPSERIIELSGRNTNEEFQSLAKTLSVEQHHAIVTSAKHMPRVLRLAQKHGVRLTPIPADFRAAAFGRTGESIPLGVRVISIVPTAVALELSSSAIHEWLASLAGR